MNTLPRLFMGLSPPPPPPPPPPMFIFFPGSMLFRSRVHDVPSRSSFSRASISKSCMELHGCVGVVMVFCKRSRWTVVLEFVCVVVVHRYVSNSHKQHKNNEKNASPVTGRRGEKHTKAYTAFYDECQCTYLGQRGFFHRLGSIL
jgi:hypothetical protein